MKTSKLLEKAQAVLLKRGWCKGEVEDLAGRVCAVGALHKVAPNDMGDAISALYAANHLGVSGSLVQFNNAPETTLGDVLQAFDAGIAYARAQEGE